MQVRASSIGDLWGKTPGVGGGKNDGWDHPIVEEVKE